MKNTFLLNTKAEFWKTKGTTAAWLTILSAAFLPAINVLVLLNRPDVFIPKIHHDPWLILFYMIWKSVAAVVLPVFVIIINNIIVQVEYRNNTWKQVYTSPRTYLDIFFSKFIVVHTYVLFFFILITLFTILAGYAVSLFYSGYLFSSHPFRFNAMFVVITRVYAGILGVTAIQYWLSMRFRNFTTSLGVGLALWIAGLLLMDWDKIVYYPYMYSSLMFFLGSPGSKGTISLLLMNAFACFAMAVFLGFRNILMQKEKG